MTAFTESEIEVFSLEELRKIGFDYLPGPSIAPEDKPSKFESVRRS